MEIPNLIWLKSAKRVPEAQKTDYSLNTREKNMFYFTPIWEFTI